MQNLSSQQKKPAVWKWYVAYCIVMALMYLFVVALGLVGIFLVETAETKMKPLEIRLTGIFIMALGLLFLIPYAAAPFLPQKKWVWYLGIVLIGIGMTSACCLPAAIPLLIFWLTPETKASFGLQSK